MKKYLIALAAAGLCAASFAQPMRPPPPPGPHMERPHARPHQRKHKVWVPAHRDHRGRMVRGHYVWR